MSFSCCVEDPLWLAGDAFCYLVGIMSLRHFLLSFSILWYLSLTSTKEHLCFYHTSICKQNNIVRYQLTIEFVGCREYFLRSMKVSLVNGIRKYLLIRSLRWTPYLPLKCTLSTTTVNKQEMATISIENVKYRPKNKTLSKVVMYHYPCLILFICTVQTHYSYELIRDLENILL